MFHALYPNRWALSALVCLVLLLTCPHPAYSANLAREAEIAAAIEARPDADDEILRLNAGDARFIGLFRPARGQQKGAVILLAGRDQGPDDLGLIGVLRRQLALRGWGTLSIQPPLLSAAAPASEWLTLGAEAVARIAAAANALKQRQIASIVLAGHDTGANQAMQFAATQKGKPVAALALLSPLPADEASIQARKGLVASDVPVLLLAAGADSPARLAHARQLGRDLRSGGLPNLAERVVPGADHGYRGQEKQVSALLANWFHRVTGQR